MTLLLDSLPSRGGKEESNDHSKKCLPQSIWNLEKWSGNGTDEPICRAGIETWRTDFFFLKERVGRIEGEALKHIHHTICELDH